MIVVLPGNEQVRAYYIIGSSSVGIYPITIEKIRERQTANE
jgi:hypothetical protein